MKNRKVIPFPKQKELPLIYKGGVLRFSAFLEEAAKRILNESDDHKEEDPSEEDNA